MTLDLYRREAGSGGSLAFGLASTATTPAIGLTLDLVMLEDLDRDAWYRLTVTGEGAAGRLEVTPLDDDRVVLEATLGLDATIAPTATDEACLRSSLPTSGASLFVDNLRVDR